MSVTRTSDRSHPIRRYGWALAVSGLVCSLLASLGAQASPATHYFDFGSSVTD